MRVSVRSAPSPSDGVATSSILTETRFAFRSTRFARDDGLTAIGVASRPASPVALPNLIVRNLPFDLDLSVTLAAT